MPCAAAHYGARQALRHAAVASFVQRTGQPMRTSNTGIGFIVVALRLQGISRSVAALAVATSTLVLTGWALDLTALKSVLPGLATMKANTALTVGMLGLSLWLLNPPFHGVGCAASVSRRFHWARSRMALILAGLPAIVGLLTLGEHIFGWQIGIDQLLVTDNGGGGGHVHPGRMVPATALNVVGLATALLLIDAEGREGTRPAQWLALLVSVTSFVAVLGYLYGVVSLYNVAAYGSVALHTAVIFLLLALGVLCARPNCGWMKQVIGDDLGGVLIRRLLPSAIAIPTSVGWLRLQGQRAGLYDTEFGLALFATTNILVFSFLIWRTAAAVRRSDVERQLAQRNLESQLGRLNLLQQITRGISERQDLPSILQVVIDALETDLPIDFGCACEQSVAATLLKVMSVGAHSRSLATEFDMMQNASITIDPSDLARCMKGQLVYEPDLRSVSAPFGQRLTRAGLESLVIAPLLAHNTVFGVLIVARRQAGGFSSGECEFLRQLSEHIALAAHQIKLYITLQEAYDDLRTSQATVLQQERLRVLGQMASGVAHDINNAISPAMLYTESLLETEQNLSAQGRDQLMTIRLAIDGVAKTVSRMQDFSRPRKPDMDLQHLDVNLLVPQVVELTRARWNNMVQMHGSVIRLQTELAAGLPTIMGVESEIRDALTNLIFNAVDAMPDGGTLTLRTRLVAAVQPGELPAVERLHVEVQDTGAGMSEETRRRCLEPFYTTKGDQGSGLGLAMVFGMVQRHSAELEIDSEPGRGTTVRLIFSIPVAASAPDYPPPPRLKPVRSLRILLVDDDPVVIKAVTHILQGDGHRVTAFDAGVAAIDAVRAAVMRNEPFGIVITDLGMPHMDGRQVAAAVHTASPATPVVMLTGWGHRLISDNELPPHVSRVLSKPPSRTDLRAALADLTMEGSAGAARLIG
jgi:signal transduction histidine kinase/CheY-like chemotaxis protein